MRSVHPRPWLDQLTQYAALLLLAFMLLTVPLQVVLALAGAGAMLLAALLTLLLCPFVLLLTTATPAVTVYEDGIDIQPLIWPRRFVPWHEIETLKPYPLLPHPGGEFSRQALVGRSHYRPAEGLMLVIPSLPVQYRIAGFLAGEGAQPVIAITNRTHSNYADLVESIYQFCESR